MFNIKSIIMIAVLFNLFSINAAAGKNPPKPHKNLICHYCRVSSHRVRGPDITYTSCSNDACRMSYCSLCIERHLGMTVEEAESSKWQCNVCQQQCCCCYHHCAVEHEHCFTFKRTEKRHAEKEPTWKKRRKSVLGSPKKEPKIKHECFDADSDVEEEEESSCETHDYDKINSNSKIVKNRNLNDHEMMLAAESLMELENHID